MKKLISVVALATLLCATAFAQENGNRDAQGNIVRGPYNRNGFFDNTFIELQGGVNLIGAPHMGMGNGFKSIKPGLALGANVGKWFNPNFGLRLGWQGTSVRYNPGEFAPFYTGSVQKNTFNYAHADFLVNVSNWWSGYKETRFWDFVPYLNVGWHWFKPEVNNFPGKNNGFGIGVGLLNKLRISNRINLTIDLREVTVTNRVLGGSYAANEFARNGRSAFRNKLGTVCSAFLGVSVNLGKTNWTRVSTTNAVNSSAAKYAGAAVAGAVVADDLAARLAAAQAKADASVKAANKALAEATENYKAALVKVDDAGNVTAAAYVNVDPQLAAAYATVANTETCPDFTTMTKKEKAAWDKEHTDILPEGWCKFTDEQKNDWVKSNIYAPAEAAKAEVAAAEKKFDAACTAMSDACKDCNDALSLANQYIDQKSIYVDGNGLVLPAAYTARGVDATTAQAYADLANSGACPDFTKMTKKEKRAWAKAHKAILPANWKNLTDEQKNQWCQENIWGPAAEAKAGKVAAERELKIAQDRKNAQDKATANIVKPKAQPAPKFCIEATPGFFTIGHSTFNAKQLANWKKVIKDINKTGDYTVTGYADQETGSKARNAQLRKERCQYVKGLLIENGFTGNITAKPSGEDERFVNTPIWKNRSAVIK